MSKSRVAEWTAADLSADEALMTRVRAGDVQAFETLFRQYLTPLYRLALRYLRDHADAEEVAQEVLLKVWERRATWAPRGSLRAYLYTVTRNHALNSLRSRTHREGGPRYRDYVELDAAVADVPQGTESDYMIVGTALSQGDPEQMLVASEQTAILRQAIAQLTERRREVLTLRWEYGLTHAEIGQVLGISTRGVEQAHARAVRELREALRRDRIS